MKLNKKFIRELIKRRQGSLDRMIGKDGLNVFDLDILNKLKALDSIMYTINFLENNKLIKITSNSNRTFLADYDPKDLRNDKDVYHLHYTFEEFKKYYSYDVKILPSIFDFQKRFYMTETQYRNNINFIWTLFIAIISAFLMALFTSLFVSNCRVLII